MDDHRIISHLLSGTYTPGCTFEMKKKRTATAHGNTFLSFSERCRAGVLIIHLRGRRKYHLYSPGRQAYTAGDGAVGVSNSAKDGLFSADLALWRARRDCAAEGKLSCYSSSLWRRRVPAVPIFSLFEKGGVGCALTLTFNVGATG